MSSRPLMIAVLAGATIGVPYLASRLPSGNKPTSSPWPSAGRASPSVSGASSLFGASAPLQSQFPTAGSSAYGSPSSLEGTRFQSIDQVLRFDVTKEWVYRNWTRKSTGPSDVGLFSVRVPLVTGTQITAVAGSLTYYFNSQGQVEHISFRGRTGDTTQLVHFLTRTYEFQRYEAPAGEQLFQVRRGSRAKSELRTRPESVLLSHSPHGSFAVELELARPGSKRFLPPRVPSLQIPQVASTTMPPATADGNVSAAGESTGSSYLNKFRYATPQEQDQVLWKRWPN